MVLFFMQSRLFFIRLFLLKLLRLFAYNLCPRPVYPGPQNPISLGPKRVPPPTSVPLSTMLVILPQLTSEPPTHRLAALYIRRVSCSAFVCSPQTFRRSHDIYQMIYIPWTPMITGFTSPTVDRSVYIRPPLCAHSFETFMQFAATLP